MIRFTKLATFLGIGLSPTVQASALESKLNTTEIQAIPLENPPMIDGNLGEWQNLPSVNGFYNPTYHERAKNDTKVWIAYDNKNLYIAAYNRDSEPEKIRAEEITRGGNIGVEYLALASPFIGPTLGMYMNVCRRIMGVRTTAEGAY